MVHLRITCQVICVKSVQWTKLKLPHGSHAVMYSSLGFGGANLSSSPHVHPPSLYLLNGFVI